MFSAPVRESERARIARAHSCDDARASAPLELSPVRAGVSRSVVGLPERRLLAGKTIVEVFRPRARGLERVSCGELRR